MGLDEQVLPLSTLLLVKKEAYANLQKSKEKKEQKSSPTQDEKMLEAEILVTKDEINAIQKKRFSLFKQLLHEKIRKDWEKVVLNQCFNVLGHVARVEREWY